MGNSLIHRCQFGQFEVQPASRQILMDGAPVAMGGRAFDLLVCLVNQRDRVVTKAELMAAGWPDTVVVENNLNTQIAALRRLLGADAIVGIIGRGCRFALGVTPVQEARDVSELDGAIDAVDTNGAFHATGTVHIPPATPARSSIAVLPFQNLSDDPQQEYFADGMAEDITTALSHFRQLVVIARNSSFTFKNRAVDVRLVGKELGVAYALKGSVRKAGRRLRITAQLIDTANSAQIWAEKFDADLTDVFDLQDQITAKVVAAIEPSIRKVEIDHARRKRPENLDAYDLCLRALPYAYAMHPDDNDKALVLFEQALALDPDFAPALAYAAWCYEQRLSRMWPNAEDAQRPIAVALAKRALEADRNDANAIGIAGFVLLMVGREVEAGLAALRHATEINPSNALISNFAGTANLFVGSLDEARVHLERARALSPSDPAAFMFITGLACVHYLSGRCGQALALATESAAINPAWEFTWMVLATAAAAMGQYDRACAAIDNFLNVLPNARISHPIFLVFADPKRRAMMQEGLRRAGLPEKLSFSSVAISQYACTAI